MSKSMNYSIHHPNTSHIPELRQLWKDTFGDSDAFLDMFFETAFSVERCLCVTTQNSVVAALYWFNCEYSNQKIAYIYAVATAKAFRGQGLCHALMERTHFCLKEQGYAGAILSPAEDSLFHFYEKMGYKTCAYTNEINYDNDLTAQSIHSSLLTSEDLDFHQISKLEFAKLRRHFLPQTAIIQENENLDYLEQQASFFAGKDFLLTAQLSTTEKHIHGIEFLGNPALLPSIMHSLGCSTGFFRTIGTDKPMGMYYPLTNTHAAPNYLGFIFD